jgi:hypothetical protein
MPRKATVRNRALRKCGMAAVVRPFVKSLAVGAGQHAGHQEYDGIKYAALPVNYSVLGVMLCRNVFQTRLVADNWDARPYYALAQPYSTRSCWYPDTSL